MGPFSYGMCRLQIIDNIADVAKSYDRLLIFLQRLDGGESYAIKEILGLYRFHLRGIPCF